ncbi:MAG: dienelactone hydrolase family protein [Rhodospirillales bacterium]|nr:MAG: dienelactone hydrolase family protein [Rhodospirillales bacterium]
MNAADVAGKMHKIEASDGHQLDCFVVSAQGAKRGGLVILQEIFGVTDQLKGVARHYAGQGFDVAIPALFDRKRREAVIPFNEAETGREIMMSLNVADNLRDVEAAIKLLGDEGKAALIGFCWGGGLALKCAQEMAVAGAVAFYGTRLKQFMDKPLKAPMLFHFGSNDDHSPPDLIAAIKETFPAAETYAYDAGHAFANDARPALYVEDAATLAHERTKAFLDGALPAR